MRPTDEQIAAMEKRGWAWGERTVNGVMPWFYAVVPADTLCLRVIWYGGLAYGGPGWRATQNGIHGLPCRDVVGYRHHVTPEDAADEAESWLRGVLSGFRFPWLRVEG